MNNKESNDYLDSIHRLGRFGSAGSLFFMLGIPLFVSYAYNIWPDMGTVFKASIGLIALFAPLAISEVISYMPILGSASYISYITGNVLNLKLPCAINSMQLAEVEQGTELGDAVATMAIAASSITTMSVITLGVLLAAPLGPIFDNPNVAIATSYMLPALFGGMFFPMLVNNQVGDYKVKNRLLPTIIPFLGVFIVNQFITPLGGYEGVALLVIIPTTLFTAKKMYEKGIIEMEKNK